MIHLPRIESLNVSDKTVFIRVDWNVPLAGSGDAVTVEDTTRIEKSAATIQLLQSRGAKLVLATHIGRPKGQIKPDLSTAHLVAAAQKILGFPLQHCAAVSGKVMEDAVRNLKAGEVLLIENVRFEAGEEKNDAALAASWSNVCELYVNDAFGAAHRAHASTVAITEKLESYAGLLLQREVEMLQSILTRPERPLVAIIGGSKVSSKIGVLRNLIGKVDTILIGGAMAYTFLKSRAIPIGNSLFEKDEQVNAFQILERAELEQCKVLLPIDHIVAQVASADAKPRTAGKMDIGTNEMGLDIGPKTIDLYEKEIKTAKTILWNGPMGMFEIDKFAKGSNAIAKAMAKSKATTIVGGGDSLAAINKTGVASKITHVSTGGGASLEFIEGKELPGVQALIREEE
jgi:phosphoglycerate kinase